MRPALWPSTKLRAAMRRGYFHTVDLFAGCGGMSLGFDRHGFRCVAAVERDDDARVSHRSNFERLVAKGQYAAHGDITDVGPYDVVSHLAGSKKSKQGVVDVIIGGPPCQAFSRLGRAALWDIAGSKHAHAEDPRATLYEHFLHYVEELRPIAFVMENVPEVGRFNGRNIAEEISLAARDLGYVTRYTLLNSVWYGVPQFRERMIMIGVRHELDVVPSFPLRTHEADIPGGYLTSRAGEGGAAPVLAPHDHYIEHAARTKERIRPAVTVRQAFRDLEPIKIHLNAAAMANGGRMKVRDLQRVAKYASRPCGFTERMRNWPGFSTNGGSTGHVIRLTPRDFPIFRNMRAGDMYPAAVEIAEALFEAALKREEEVRNIEIVDGSPDWERLRKAIVPPYKLGRFENKFRKMAYDEPARTVPAHLGKDCYSHIHPDDRQARTISVREAARLQSFPDAFGLSGTMNSCYTQIGNAVPPLMAAAIAAQLRADLKFAARKTRPD